MRFGRSWPLGAGRRGWVSFGPGWLLAWLIVSALSWVLFAWWAWLLAEVLLAAASVAVLAWNAVLWAMSGFHARWRLRVLPLRYHLLAVDSWLEVYAGA